VDRLLSSSWIAWGGIIYAVLLIASLVGVSIVIVLLPATYFQDRSDPSWWLAQHPVTRGLLRVAKNLLGLALAAIGLVLSIPGIPGQGVLTILIALMLLDFPGKRRLERRLVARPRVLRTLNWIRLRAGKPPLVIDPPAENV
jgi:lysylphosphatidylglycerol synthetase-like protein (DUF2156 family)